MTDAARDRARAALLDHLPIDRILNCYDGAGGGEILSGKFASPESSASLAANAFGLFLDSPALLMLPVPAVASGMALRLSLEAQLRFPWRGGRHPWLDAAVETDATLIGIESKRYEPFRDRKTVALSEAYWRPVWGDRMAPFERMRDDLAAGTRRFVYLDATQLVKHAFGLRTQAQKQGKRAALLYLYAEPKAYPDGRVIAPAAIEAHRLELAAFTAAVTAGDAEVSFCGLPYRALLESWSAAGDDVLTRHAAALRARFDL